MAGTVKEVTIKINVETGEIVQGKKEFDKLNNSVTKGSTQMKGSVSNLNKSLVSMGGALVGAFAVKAAIGDAVQRVVQFQKSISSLSAITGAVGKDLEKLKGLVLDVAKNTKTSAIEIAKAFELVGSKAPKLLENADALAKVTEEAITLNKASGGELVDSVGALTGVMNQFNLEADQSGRIINALAAGSQKGAAPVTDIAQAIDKFGTVAAAANVSVEGSIGLVETLAEKNINGAEAGTQLRNIILKLQSANIGFTDGVFNLNDALEEVKNKNLTAAESAKLFGLESVTAGNILVNGTETVDKYTEAVTGTNTAYEQAEIQTDNLATKTKELDATYENLILSLEDGTGVLSEFSKGIIDQASSFLVMLTNINEATTGLEAMNAIGTGWLSTTGQLTEKQAEFNRNILDGKNVIAALTERFESGSLTQEQYLKLVNQVGEGYKATTKNVKESTDAIIEEEEAIIKAGETSEKRIERLKAESAARSALRKQISEDNAEANALDDEENDAFLDSLGLSDEQLEKQAEQQTIKQELLQEAADEKLSSEIENNALAIEQEQAFADAKATIDEQILNSAINLAGALANAAGANAETQVAILAFQKAIEIGKIIAATQSANAIIFSEGAALAIPSAGASVAAAAGLITANNINAGLNIATIAATAIPQAAAILKKPAFKDGVIDLQGAGTGTSDSIDARLSKGESVMTAKETLQHKPLLKAIRNNTLDEHLDRIILQKLYSGGKSKKEALNLSSKQDVNFPERMSISNARAISKPIVDAMEEQNFLNEQGWA